MRHKRIRFLLLQLVWRLSEFAFFVRLASVAALFILYFLGGLKMKKLIAFIGLAVCVVLIFASCSKDMTLSEFYADYEYKDGYPTLNNFEMIDELSELNCVNAFNDIIVFADEHKANIKTKFYNAKTESFIIERDRNRLVFYTSRTFYNHTFIITVEIDFAYTLNIYSASGSKLASKKIEYETNSFNIDEHIKSSSDLIQFDKRIYRIDDSGNASVIVDNPFFGEIPSDLIKTKKYYYQLNGSKVTVYDPSLNEVLLWQIPYESYDKASMFILSEEKILVQLFDSVSEHEQRNEYIEEKYKYFDKNGKELALKSLIIDVASGREKEVYLDFVVNEITYSRGRIYPHNEFDYISENITNVAYIYRIENQKLLTADQKCVSISGEDASISFEIAPEYSTLPYPVANDRYCYISDSGDYYLINADGDVIAKIKSTNTIVKYNDKYIATDDKIYDYNIKLVYDLEENKKELVELMANGFIVKDSEFTEGEYHLHTKDGKIIKIENYYDSSSQYYTRTKNVVAITTTNIATTVKAKTNTELEVLFIIVAVRLIALNLMNTLHAGQEVLFVQKV